MKELLSDKDRFFSQETAPQLFGRLWCLPDGSPTVFHESLEWTSQSRVKPYSYQNAHYAPHRSDLKVRGPSYTFFVA